MWVMLYTESTIMGRVKITNLKMGFDQNRKILEQKHKNPMKKKAQEARGTYRVIMHCGGIGGEED